MSTMTSHDRNPSRRFAGCLLLAAGALALATLCGAPSASAATARVSVSSAGAPGNRFSFAPSISKDARFVAFESLATNLVEPGLRRPKGLIFVRDRMTRKTTLVSGGLTGRLGFSFPSISADGRFVAFMASRRRYDRFRVDEVFVRDLVTHELQRVSVGSAGGQANEDSGGRPSISADGRFVAFSSDATDLVEGGTNPSRNIFVRDLKAKRTVLVSKSSAGSPGRGFSEEPGISANGRFVAFSSDAVNLVGGDTNGTSDVFLHDRARHTTTRVSVSSVGAQADGSSFFPSISADGRFVAFNSQATNLVDGDTNGVTDVFLHDRMTGSTTLVSQTGAGARADGDSFSPKISADGRFVAFNSQATNLVDGDTNGTWDIFVHDRVTGETRRVNTSGDGAQANAQSTTPVISADGRFVAFSSFADNLVRGDTNQVADVFLVGPLEIQP